MYIFMCSELQHLVELIIVHDHGGGGHVQVMVFMMTHRWCEGTLGIKKSTEETDSTTLK